MRSSISILFFVLLLISSCKNESKKNQVALFNNLTFALNEGEKNAKPNEFDLENYKAIQDKVGLAIPLFKVIKTEQYKIFIGMPYGMTFEDISESLQAKIGKESVLTNVNGVQTCSQQWEDDHKAYSSLVYSSDNNMVYIVTSQPESVEHTSLLSPTSLTERINKSK